MIWYNNLDAAATIRSSMEEDRVATRPVAEMFGGNLSHKAGRRTLRLVAAADRAAR